MKMTVSALGVGSPTGRPYAACINYRDHLALKQKW